MFSLINLGKGDRLYNAVPFAFAFLGGKLVVAVFRGVIDILIDIRVRLSAKVDADSLNVVACDNHAAVVRDSYGVLRILHAGGVGHNIVGRVCNARISARLRFC